MLEQGYISQKQYDKAMSDDVYARIQATSASSQADNAYSYFVDALAQQVIQDLKDQLATLIHRLTMPFTAAVSVSTLHKIRKCRKSVMKKLIMMPTILV